VVAVDRSKKELAGLRSNTKRMGIQHVYPLCADISEGVPVKRTFQTVFLDSPCSGLGTVRRHPEAKWIKGEEIVARVAGVQSDLLQAAAEKTAPGGHLLYSVCSFEPEETGDRIRGFLERNPDFQIDPLNGMMKGMEELETEEGFYRAFPGQREMDGYFVARLVRR
jgi:16S rRNA (cytosine967-C5)-methyltransferase